MRIPFCNGKKEFPNSIVLRKFEAGTQSEFRHQICLRISFVFQNALERKTAAKPLNNCVDGSVPTKARKVLAGLRESCTASQS
mmetsp:Transcript_24129/g.47405  ORF Transcript_24129/g.47405 Transcript_24129/m.47405 type:complete len:83 (+) Transcript_24129:415-663(+)